MIVSRKSAEQAWDVLAPYSALAAPDLASTSVDNVRDIFRDAVRKTHPDAGGSVESFAAVDRAKHVLLAWLERQGASEASVPHGGVTTCPRCQGKRTIDLQKGFRTMKVQCPTCHGNGEIYDEKDKGVDRQ